MDVTFVNLKASVGEIDFGDVTIIEDPAKVISTSHKARLFSIPTLLVSFSLGRPIHKRKRRISKRDLYAELFHFFKRQLLR